MARSWEGCGSLENHYIKEPSRVLHFYGFLSLSLLLTFSSLTEF